MSKKIRRVSTFTRPPSGVYPFKVGVPLWLDFEPTDLGIYLSVHHAPPTADESGVIETDTITATVFLSIEEGRLMLKWEEGERRGSVLLVPSIVKEEQP